MKKWSALYLGLLVFAFSACEADDVTPADCFEVKVISSYCTGDAVLQIITPSAQPFGETWTSSDGTTYEHVFRTRFHCSFQSVRLAQTFSVRLIDDVDEPEDCARCLMLVTGLPDKFSHISLTSDCSEAQN